MSLARKLTLDRFEERLVGREQRRLRARDMAAVAAVVRFAGGCSEVLLMRRAERQGDRWSGHVSFPGGREEEGDDDLLVTARRETREELGLDLDECARYLGPLDPVRAIAKGRLLPTGIAPFVFVQTKEQPIVLSEEATRAFWLPLDLAASGKLDDTYDYRLGPTRMSLPCWRYDGETVWGLTYRMLRELLDLVG